jgi:hypothetical protein
MFQEMILLKLRRLSGFKLILAKLSLSQIIYQDPKGIRKIGLVQD